MASNDYSLGGDVLAHLSEIARLLFRWSTVIPVRVATPSRLSALAAAALVLVSLLVGALPRRRRFLASTCACC